MARDHLPTPASRLAILIDGQPVSLPDADKFSIGRDPTADIPIDDTRVSRRHAILFREQGGWHFSDTESSNGSFLDGQLVLRLAISDPVVLRLGDPFFGTLLSITPLSNVVQATTILDDDVADADVKHVTPPSGNGFLISEPAAMPPRVIQHHPEPSSAAMTEITRPPAPLAGRVVPTVDGMITQPTTLAPPARPSPPTIDPDDVPAAIDSAIALRFVGISAIFLGVVMFLNTREIPVPLILLLAGLILTFYISSPTRLMRDQVIDSWGVLIDSAQGRGAELMTSTTARIDIQQLPSVAHAERQFTASLVRGGPRPFLVVSQQANRRLKPYKMYVGVRDYGTNLQINWFLIYHRGFFEKLKPNPLVDLNLFDEQDLRAYVTAVHHAFLDGVIDLMLSLGQDTSKINRATKGFLGIS